MTLTLKTLDKIKEMNKILEIKNPNLKLIGFIDFEYKTCVSKTIVECKNHGRGVDFDNPWTPRYNDLRSGYGCPKCSNSYQKTTQEAINYLNQIIAPSLNVISFLEDEYTSYKSKVIINCNIHGLGCNFGNPWNPTYDDLRSGYGCPKCGQCYRPTIQEAIDSMNQIIHPNLKLIGFLNGKYNSKNSKTIVECKTHGLGCNFKKPWNPVYSSLKYSQGCPKCSDNYFCSNEEAINKINTFIHPDLKFINFINENFEGSSTKMIVECNIHGRGCHFKKIWNPCYMNIIAGNGCPICSVEKNLLKKCINNINYFHFKRNIYFITFKNLLNDKIFYKIGITTEKGFKKRFRLKNDNIKIISVKEITTNNILALLTEYYVLNHFKEYKQYMFHVLKSSGGGFNC